MEWKGRPGFWTGVSEAIRIETLVVLTDYPVQRLDFQCSPNRIVPCRKEQPYQQVLSYLQGHRQGSDMP